MPVRLRRWLIVLLLILTLLIAGAFALWQISRARCWQLVGTPICSVDTSERLVALTFDDGPSPMGTTYALETLARYDAKATFFLIGEQLAEHPGEARRLVEAGHEIANHSYSHRQMIGLLPSPSADEVARTDALLRREGGGEALLFRPPYGKKLLGLPLALSRSGHRTIMWELEEPVTDDPRAYADALLAKVRPGSIVLMHIMVRSRQVARDALPLVLAGLAERGYRVVTVSELLASGTPRP
jgi:peptidoglycan-N-acetylglucosamine deacetylase